MRAFLRDLGQASLFLLAIFLGSILGSLLFSYLPVIPVLSNPREIVSPLTALNFAPANNVIRVGLYLLSPILFFLLLRPLRARLAPPSPESLPELYSAKSAWLLTQLFFLALALSFLGTATFLDTREVDDFWFFHEGEWLGPAWKWFQTGEIWKGSFFAHGAFYDALGSGLAWKIFSVTNIAASRVMTSFLEKIVYLPLMALVVACAHFTYAVKSRYSAAIFSSLAMITVFFLTRGQWQHFERRDFPALCGFLFFLCGLGTSRQRWFSLAGIFLGSSWIYSIDRGVYLTVSFFATLGAVAIFTRNWKEPLRQALALSLGWGISFLAFGLILGFPELAAGIRTTAQLFAIKDLSDGSVYPPPAFPISNWKFLRTTHTLPLVCLAIQLLAFFSLLQKNKWRLAKDSAWLVQLSLLLVSLAYYRGALSRCDEVHYRYVSSFAFLGAALMVARAFCESALWRLRSAQALLCLAALLLPAQTLWGTGRLVYGNAKNFPGNIREFLRTKDEAFLPSWQIETAAFLAREFRGEKCFASLVSEPLWIYLLKKSHCGKFHLAWLISDKGLQFEAIEELKATNPEKILVHTPRSGDEMDGVPIEIRARYLYGYVAENYRPGANFKGWEVWGKK